MYVKKILTGCVALIMELPSYAQQGILQGTIYDKQNKTTLPGATLQVMSTSIGTSADFDGNFKLSLDPGTYTLVAGFIGYRNDTIKNLTIKNGQTISLNIALEESSLDLKEFEVVAVKTTHSVAAVVEEIKNAEQVVNGISAEQINRSQDRNTSEVMRRIPGVSILNNRFVMIRGLNDRYNATMINGVLSPGFESDKRAFSFDILPSGVIDRIMIYKTGSADMPGDFSGGLVKLYTKSVVDSSFVNINYSSSYLVGTTFRDFISSPRGKTDFLGFDDGTRALPTGFPHDLKKVKEIDDKVTYSQMLPNTWNITSFKAIPDQRFSITLGNKFPAMQEKLSQITVINYGLSYVHYSADNYSYNAYDPQSQRSDTIYRYQDDNYTENARIGIMSNWLYLLNARNKFLFQHLFNQNGINTTTLRSGYNLEEGFIVRNYAFNYQQRTLYNAQLSGEHEINRSTLLWNLAYGLTHNNQPDFRRVRTVKDIQEKDFQTNYQVIIPPSASVLDAGRFFANLQEKVFTGTIDYEYRITDPSEKAEKKPIKIKGGLYTEKKDRSFSARWISYKKARNSTFNNDLLLLPVEKLFSTENINDSTGLILEEGTNPSDRYIASNMLAAAYIMLTTPLSPKVNLNSGIRIEHNIQELSSRNYSNEPVIISNPVTSILPSMNISYNFTKKSLLRLAYFTSVNRPEFRELAPFAYYDFNFNNVLFGNNKLKNATIHNADLRYELYPQAGEMITMGVFYKYFIHPIEMYFVPGSGSGGTRNFTYDNAPEASSIGSEVEIRKSLSSLFNKKAFSNLSLVMNAAYIFSEVNLGNTATGQSTKRPLMGQSPYLINAGIFYDNSNKGISINALYNIIGKRIFVVGTYGTPDIYEMPRNMLDLNLSKTFRNKYKFTLSAQNILNSPVRLIQNSNENNRIDNRDEVILYYKAGPYFTAGLSLTF